MGMYMIIVYNLAGQVVSYIYVKWRFHLKVESRYNVDTGVANLQ